MPDLSIPDILDSEMLSRRNWLGELFHNEKDKVHMEQGMRTEDNQDKREVGRLLDELNKEVVRLSEHVQTLVERTAPVAAMERPIPDESGPMDDRDPQTEYGSRLSTLIQQVQLISSRVSEHCYRMEV